MSTKHFVSYLVVYFRFLALSLYHILSVGFKGFNFEIKRLL